MGSRPASSLNELVCGQGQHTEILLVLTGSVVYERVELEVDLVQPRREMDCQTIAELCDWMRSRNPFGCPKSIRSDGPGVSHCSERPKSRATRLRASTSPSGSASALRSDPASQRATTSTSLVGRSMKPRASSPEPPTTTQLVVLAAGSELLGQGAEQLSRTVGARDVSHPKSR